MLPLFVLIIFLALGYAKSCSNPVLSTSYRTPVLASGYSLQLLTKNLTSPRHIVFDSSGNLLVAGGPDGIIALVLNEPENDGCISVREQKLIIENGDLNLEHGISLSPDGRTLYASSPEAAYSWSYDSTTISASNQRALVTGMLSRGHITRTLLAPRSYPDFLIISRGSDGNLDYDAQNLASGKSMIRAFNITGIGAKPYNYTTDGVLLGWGLRNSVGVGEDRFGGVWSVENSADQITRSGIDIHENNPAEEMNWHGYLNQTVGRSGYSGRNYGYPYCLTAWKADTIPSSSNLKTGSQFALSPNTTFGDEQCRDDFQSPRISFPAHTAPLDIKFHPKSGDAWISFHGSWNRDDPAGYKLSVVPFSNGQPQAASDSASAAVDVVWNRDTVACPDACFRPVGVAFDGVGRVWMSSDSTGEIFVVTPPKNYGAAGSPKNESSSSNSSFALRVPILCGLLWGGIGTGLIMWS